VGPSPTEARISSVEKGKNNIVTVKVAISFTSPSLEWLKENANTAGFELLYANATWVPAPIEDVSTSGSASDVLITAQADASLGISPSSKIFLFEENQR